MLRRRFALHLKERQPKGITVDTAIYSCRRGLGVDTPSIGRSLAIAIFDLGDAIHRYPLWIHQGWIDVVQRYRRTIIGPFWHTLSLGIFIVSMGAVWAVILKVDIYSYFRLITINLMIWNLISNSITEGTGILIAGQATAL